MILISPQKLIDSAVGLTMTNNIGDLVTSLDSQCKNLRSSMESLAGKKDIVNDEKVIGPSKVQSNN